jgi:hypothetical protein
MNDLNTKKIISFVGGTNLGVLMFLCDNPYLSIFFGIGAIFHLINYMVLSAKK